MQFNAKRINLNEPANFEIDDEHKDLSINKFDKY